jgi:hypothetical protein
LVPHGKALVANLAAGLTFQSSRKAVEPYH